MKRRIGMQRARAQKKLEQFRMFKTQLLITCMLVQICANDGATAGLWIRHTRSRTKKERERLQGWDHEQLRFMALLFHAEHCSEATKWRYPPTEHYAKCRQKAYNFIAEARLHTWVEQQNYQTGLAPTSEELIHEYARAWPHSGVPGIQNTARFLLSSKPWARRKWAQRWRRRWKVSHRKLKILPPMSREECEKKVIFRRSFRALFLTPLLAPQM